MQYGTNKFGKEFEVVDEDGVPFHGFDTLKEATAVANALPWYFGKCWIRRDENIVRERHKYQMELKALYERDFQLFCYAA